MTVPEPERGRVALLYDAPRADSADGEVQVTFEACDDPDTGFPGYFLVAGPRCVELEVHHGKWRRSYLPAVRHLRLRVVAEQAGAADTGRGAVRKTGGVALRPPRLNGSVRPY